MTIFPRGKGIEFRSPIVKLSSYQNIARVWASRLSPPEYMLLMELVDRSHGWGRYVVDISDHELLNGSGIDALNQGINIGKRTLIRARKALVEHGCIEILSKGIGQTPYCYLVKVGMDEMVNIPKAKKAQILDEKPTPEENTYAEEDWSEPDEKDGSEVSERPLRGANVTPQRCQPDTSLYKTGNKQQKNNKFRSAEDGEDSIEEVIEQAKATNKASVDQSIAKAKVSLSAKGLEQAWKEAFPPEFKSVATVAWTKREKGALMAMTKRYDGSGAEFIDFLMWSVSNWAYVMRTCFAKMRDAPPEPAILFWIRFVDSFTTEYQARMQKRAIQAIDDPFEREVARLVAAGVPREEAIRKTAGAEGRKEANAKRVVVKAPVKVNYITVPQRDMTEDKKHYKRGLRRPIKKMVDL